MDKVRDISAKRKAKEDEQAVIDAIAGELQQQKAEFMTRVDTIVKASDQVFVIGYEDEAFRFFTAMGNLSRAEMLGYLYDALATMQNGFADMDD